jgi:predicted acylesterase/phospholipase RssA
MAVFNAGGAALAVQASTGLPGVFAATTLAGRDYADGALSSPLPVRVARELGAQRVIAIDVIYPPVESRLDGMVDRLFQIGLVLTHSLATQEAQEADLVIRPSLPAELSVYMNNRQRDGAWRRLFGGPLRFESCCVIQRRHLSQAPTRAAVLVTASRYRSATPRLQDPLPARSLAERRP